MADKKKLTNKDFFLSEESIAALTPEEKKALQQEQKKESNQEQIKEDLSISKGKYQNQAGNVRITYCSAGRFSIPAICYFKDFTVRDVSRFAVMSRQADILESIIATVQTTHIPETKDVSITSADMLIEEFYETLIGMKMQFGSIMHKHYWMCDCQADKEPDKQKYSIYELDLRDLKYRNIEEIDEKLKVSYQALFDSLDDEGWRTYLINKYQDPDVIFTKEEELQKIKLVEPVSVNFKGNRYKFRFTRISDLAEGFKYARKRADGKIRVIKAKQMHGIKKEEREALQKEEIAPVEQTMREEMIITTKARSLISVDNKKLTLEQKITNFGDLDQSVLEKLDPIFGVEFGVFDEREMTCEHCGETSRRSLQRSFNPVELLPVAQSKDNSSDRKLQKSAAVDIYLGV